MSESTGRRGRGRLILPAAGVGLMLVLAPVVLLAGAGNPPCGIGDTPIPGSGPGAGPWKITVYGPPWDAMNGGGVTAFGVDLTAAPHVREIAIDPAVLTPRGFYRVWPNPLNSHDAFYAGDTGGAIKLHHVDVYWWAGHAADDAWGHKYGTVTPAATPGTGNLLGQIAVGGPLPAGPASPGGCELAGTGPLPLTPGQTARILPNGLAAAPQDAPRAVKLAIAAGNQIVDKPYIWGGGHGQPLTVIAGGYDCSGSTSFVLHDAGALGDYAEDSTQLESYGQAGPGQWITVYANSGHAFIDVAGVVLDTAWYAPVEPTTPGSGPRWQPASIIPAQYAGDMQAGHGGFVQRHLAGL